MRIVEVNSVNYGSTGNIMLDVAEVARGQGNEVLTFCQSSRTAYRNKFPDHYYIGNRYERNLHLFLAKVTGFDGCFSYWGTRRFLKRLNDFRPDIIHIHNLHGRYINLPLLFRYIKKHDIPVVWTLHDCWAFTGQCPYFTMVECDKWKTGCYDCPQYRQYPESYVDRTKKMYKLKRKWFTSIENMTIVTPSQWLTDLVRQSYLREYPLKVINNGIDLNLFKPTKSDFRDKYGLNGKFILLGVAFGWGKRKGLDVFIELAKRLSENYQIVLVGTDSNIDSQLPVSIVSVHRTENQQELAKLYSAADVFVNPTREDNFPTVNMESIACGTPVVTFKTGGSPEILDATCGSVVECDNVDTLEREILRICERKPFSRENCIKNSRIYDMNRKFQEYMNLYSSLSRK